MTKAQERAREYALKAWHEWDEKTENQDRDGNTLYWLGETGFIELIARAYAQGQRDLVEAGVSVWVCPEWREVKPAILASPNQIMEGDVEVLIIERKLVGVEDDNKA